MGDASKDTQRAVQALPPELAAGQCDARSNAPAEEHESPISASRLGSFRPLCRLSCAAYPDRDLPDLTVVTAGGYVPNGNWPLLHGKGVSGLSR